MHLKNISDACFHKQFEIIKLGLDDFHLIKYDQAIACKSIVNEFP